MSRVQLRNVTDAPGRGPARTIMVGGVSLSPGKIYTFPAEPDKYTMRYVELCEGLVHVGEEPAAPVAAPVEAPVEEEAEAEGLEGHLSALTYSTLVELHDLVSDEAYTGKRSKTAAIEALLELDEGDVLAALE